MTYQIDAYGYYNEVDYPDYKYCDWCYSYPCTCSPPEYVSVEVSES